MKAFAGEGAFRALLEADPDVTAVLDGATIAACFDLDRALAHTGAIIDRALAAP